MTRDGNEM